MLGRINNICRNIVEQFLQRLVSRPFDVSNRTLLHGIGLFLGRSHDVLFRVFRIPPSLGKNVSNLFLNLSGQAVASVADAKKAGLATLNYGIFLNNVVNFLIVAFTIFVLLKQINRFKREEAAAPAPPHEPTQTEKLLSEIRDLLAKGK